MNPLEIPTDADVKLADLAEDFARGLIVADSKSPVALNSRSGVSFQAGIGPHSETDALALVVAELRQISPKRYDQIKMNVPYPEAPRQKCDFCIGQPPEWEWAIEAKLVRFLGDNGKPNNNMVMHLLSPFPADRSAVTDCFKLASSRLGMRKAVLIYGFDDPRWPLVTAVEAFERLAAMYTTLSDKASAQFKDLLHPVHNRGAVYVWEIGVQPEQGRR